MAKQTQSPQIAGLQISANPSVLAGFLVLAVIFTSLLVLFSGMSFLQSLTAGLAAALLHYLSGFWHQSGHAFAARKTGHPMSGVHFWGVLEASRYPEDEGDLPARLHIRRGLGGPVASLVLTIATGLFTWLLLAGWLHWLFAILFLDNLLVFTLGALLPLGFTDGSTLLHWWPRR